MLPQVSLRRSVTSSHDDLHVMWCHVTWCHVMSRDVKWCHVTSSDITSHDVMVIISCMMSRESQLNCCSSIAKCYAAAAAAADRRRATDCMSACLSVCLSVITKWLHFYCFYCTQLGLEPAELFHWWRQMAVYSEVVWIFSEDIYLVLVRKRYCC